MGNPNQTKRNSGSVGLEGYIVRTLGSLPPNLGVCFLQAVSEAVVDTTRTGVEIAKAPIRYSRGETEEAVSKPLKAAAGGVLNVLRNLTRPLQRSHRMGVEDPEMLDLSFAFKKSASQLGNRFKLLGESLTPDQKKQLARELKEKLNQVVPEEANRAQRQLSGAMKPAKEPESSTKTQDKKAKANGAPAKDEKPKTRKGEKRAK